MFEERIVIVRQSAWGGVKKETYDSQINLIKEALEEATEKYYHQGKERERKRAKSVEVVDTIEEVWKKAKRDEMNILIFLSAGRASEARAIKEKYRHLKVLILTGLIPDGEIIWVSKRWASEMKILKTIVFD